MSLLSDAVLSLLADKKPAVLPDQFPSDLFKTREEKPTFKKASTIKEVPNLGNFCILVFYFKIH